MLRNFVISWDKWRQKMVMYKFEFGEFYNTAESYRDPTCIG